MKKIAVILSGCGRDDGSEIHESVLTLLALDKAGVRYQCLAPNINQQRVMNHYTNEASPEIRNVLVESARIARGEIKPLEEANPDDYDAAILPGGFGTALNLSNFATQGAECEVIPSVKRFIQGLAKAGKPVGFICIAPVMVSNIYGPGVKHTIGCDAATADLINAMGGLHQNCFVEDCVVDSQHKVVSTPAYMLAK
ncbi:MAG: isoprenoid biosynthesis glyoxalase ElbB [Methylophilus sp.]|jgi:enhancing lycopene biosynthesis protein 2